MPYNPLTTEQLQREILKLDCLPSIAIGSVKPANDEDEFYDSLAYHRAMCSESTVPTHILALRRAIYP